MAWTKTYQGEEPLRINKWLALEGVCSRREADSLIEKGLIKLDGEVLKLVGQKIEKGQTLTVTQRATRRLDNQLSVVLYKPVGYVSGTPEPNEVPAVRLITKENLSGRAHAIPGRYNKLAPLGRLDKDSRGLLILSEDGVLAKAIIGPNSDLEKEYIVKVKGEITPDKLDRLRHGLELDGRKLKPAIIERLKSQELKFILREGRKRQIRRMCELVDLRVADLMRVRIGPLELSGLAEGMWRPLAGRERSALLKTLPPRPKRDDPRPKRDDAGPKRDKVRPIRDETRPKTTQRDDERQGDRAKTAGPRPTKFKRTKLGPRKRTPIK